MVKPKNKTIRLKTKDETAESRILGAARQEFIERGLGGARMQAIADRAGANKALLHYYFRSKEKLYDAALQDILRTVFGALRRELPQEKEGDDLRSLLRIIVTIYIKTLQQNPDFPRFMLRELADGGRHFPDMVSAVIASFGDIPQRIYRLLVAESRAGRIKKLPPIHFALNVLGMCIFTFLARPIISSINDRVGLGIAFDDAFFSQRIDAIVTMACDGIYKEHRT
jgi:AcrR family transcriptional regulator